MKLMRPSLPLSLFALLSLAGPSFADDGWELIVKDRERQVELDRSTVILSDSGTKVAWARIVLSPERAAAEGYAIVKALNRFDCYNRSFYTVKRVYLDARQLVLREEGVLEQNPVLAARNSVDERLWQEVCRPPSVGELQKVARDAVVSAAVSDPTKLESPPVPLPDAAAAFRAPPNVSRGGPRRAGIAEPTAAKVDKTAAANAATAEAKAETSGPGRPAAETAAADAIGAFAARLSGAPTFPTAPAAAPSSNEGSAGSAGSVWKPFDPAVRHGTQWSYDGDTGPERWGRLRPEWALCSDGKRQSPIDLRDGIAVELEPLRFDYRATRFRITDTGQTLKVDVGEGMGVEVRGQRYELEHLQFYRPSVERVGGQASAMAVHLHHRAADGKLAIVAVLLERGDAPHLLVQTLWNSLPLERGGHYMPATATIDPATLLPADPGHYLYLGSLVTPPCTEGVTWAVMKSPLMLSDEQLAIFARLYPRNGRPIQPRNGRIVLESR